MKTCRESLVASTFFTITAALCGAACVGAMPDESGDVESGERGLSGASTLVRRGSGKCLDVSARGVADGTKIQQWTCNSTVAQEFVLEDRGNGAFRLRNPNADKCVDATGNGVNDGTAIQLWTCNDSGAQDFQRRDLGDGYAELFHPRSGKCLDVSGNSTDDGAKVQLWTCNKTDAQAWRLPAANSGDGDGDTGSDADLSESFVNLARWSADVRASGGSIGISSAAQSDDNHVASLTLPGRPDLTANDWASPDYASELELNDSFLYGKFETRVRFSACSSQEEVVNGIFTYAHGGDQNGNGITDNSEIDIEYLCGTPSILWLTTYTDFDDFAPGRLRKLSRKVDLRSGAFEVYTDWPPTTTASGTVPGLAIPGFPAANEFYTVGFEWRAQSVRYYIRLNGKEVDLFVINDASRVPHGQAGFLINIWHANAHWTNGASADYPTNPASMLVDSVKIWR